jgi:hypothetical protein
MNEEIKTAAEEVLAKSSQSDEYKRRTLKLLHNAISASCPDADIRQVIDLFQGTDEE